MKNDWIAVAKDISECARKKAATDQEKLDTILKRTADTAQERVVATSR